MSEASEQALKFMNSGHNCAESTLLALAQKYGVDAENLYQVASGMGGGFAANGEVCGAVSGGTMAIGLTCCPGKGERSAEDKAAISAKVNAYLSKFKETNGALRCHDLLGVALNTEEGQKVFGEQGLRAHCLEFVSGGVEMIEALLDETE